METGKIINKNFCDFFFSKFLKEEWGIVAGFNTLPEDTVIFKKKLLDLQDLSDCDNNLCKNISNVTIVSYCQYGHTGERVLNPPLSPDENCWRDNRINVNEIAINTFYR